MSEVHQVEIKGDASGLLKAFQDVSGAAGKTAATVEGMGDKASQGLAKTATAASSATTSMSKFGSALGAIGNVASGVIGATLVGVLSEASRAAAEAEASQARLEQAISNTGAAFELYAPAIERAVAASVQLGFDDEDTADAIANMAQMTGDAAQAIDLLATAQDLARAKGISLAQASTIIGKVATGNTSILARYGIVVKDGATATEALGAIQQQTAGQAQRYGQTQAAAIDRLQTSWGNLMENIGGMAGPLQAVLGVLPGVSTAFQAAGGAASTLAGGLPKLIGMMNPLALGIGAASGAAVLAAAAFLKWRDSSAKMEEAAVSLQAALADITSEQTRQRLSDLVLVWDDLKDPDINWQGLFPQDQISQMEQAWAGAVNAAQAATTATENWVGELEYGQGVLLEMTKAGTIGPDLNTAAIEDFTTILTQGSAKAKAELKDLIEQIGNADAASIGGILNQVDVLASRTTDATDEMSGLGDSITETGAAAEDAAASIADLADTIASDIKSAVSAIQSLGDDAIAAAKETEKAAVDAAKSSAEEIIKAAEKSGEQRIRAVEQAGKATARAAESAANDQIKAAERAEEQVTDAARRQADAQIEAAKAAEEALVASAEAAADGQIQAAERAEKTAVKAANKQAQSQIKAAQSAANATVRAAQQAANQQIAAADRLEEQAAEQAKAREEAVVAAAEREHDRVVERANSAADAQIAAAERATDRKMALIDQELQKAQAGAVTEANKILTDANNQALAKLRDAEQKYGADSKQYAEAVAETERDLAKAQEEAARKQADLMEEAAKEAERAKERAQRQEERRIARIQAQRDAAIEASAARLAAIEEQAHRESLARIEQAAKVAEQMRSQAAANVARVEKEQARAVEKVRREAERNSEQAAREAAKRTEAVRAAAELRLAAVREQAAAETAAKTEAINANTERVIQAAARETERVRREAERSVVAARRETAQQVRAIDRETTQVRREQERQVTAVVEEEAAKRETAVATIEENTKSAVQSAVLEVAKLDPVIADVLIAQGVIKEGASGEFEVIIGDQTLENLAVIENIFGPDAVQLQADGTVTIVPNPTSLNNYLTMLNRKAAAGQPVAYALVNIVPQTGVTNRGVPQNERTPGYADGGVVRLAAPVAAMPAANGRTVLVGEAGPELVTLPAGSRVVSNPATEARLAGGGGVTIAINGDVYGMDDFRSKVGQAAAEVLARTLPTALGNRRRALGGI